MKILMYLFGMFTFWFSVALFTNVNMTGDTRKWFIVATLAFATAFIFSIVEYLKEKK